jgi:predicted permease
MESLVQDVRYGLRVLRRSPGFTAVAVLTLALGIGANTAIFTLVHAVMLKSLPVANPDELYSLGDFQTCCDTTSPQDNVSLYSYPLYKQLREDTPEFSQLAAFQTWVDSWSVRRSGSAGVPEPRFGQFVSGNYFSTFGVDGFAGRTLAAADDRPGAPPVAMMSYRAWQQYYALDPKVIGDTFSMNGQPVTVVGVTPPGYFGDTVRANPPDFWAPLSVEPLLDGANSLLNSPGEYWLFTTGRLKPGAQLAPLQARVTAEIQQWLKDHSVFNEQDRQQTAKLRMTISRAGAGVTRLRNGYADGLRLLMIVSGLVLLIACANIANLLLARGMGGQGQTAVRVALGAGQGRLIRQTLTEGVLLALLGGVAGIGVAFASTKAILLLAFRGASYVPISAGPSLPALAFTFVLSLLTGVIFSTVPAWIASRTHPAEALRGAGRTTRDHSVLPQKSLVVFQAALSLVLLVGAGLLTVSLRNLENQQFGFETQGRLIVRINPALAGYSPERLPVLYQQLQERFSRIPGVLSASLALRTPFDNWNWNTVITVAGRAPAADPNDDNANYDWVSAHYFETMGTHLLRGRGIDEHDIPTSHHTAVINQALARKFFPNEDPIGRHLGFVDGHGGDYEIVGIVEDTKYIDPTAPALPMFFVPLLQTVKYEHADDSRYQTWANYIDSIQLRVAGRPENLQALVRHTLAEVDPNLTVIRMTNLDEQVGIRLNTQRLIARLTTLYGVLALILASIGLYGVAAYTVARRTREIGLRMALGANRTNVVTMVVRGAMTPVVLGLTIGIPVLFAGGRAIASQLYGVKGYDPRVLLAAVSVLALSAIVAAVVPARRAAQVDPMVALRYE